MPTCPLDLKLLNQFGTVSSVLCPLPHQPSCSALLSPQVCVQLSSRPLSPSVHRFSVGVEPGTKVESGPASLHLCNSLLVLTRGVPPVTVGHWKMAALRRYGAVPNGFVFEGGSRCGYCE